MGHLQENPMLKLFAIAAVATLLAACAATDPMPARGSTASGEATAAQMGFHGPMHRARKIDGPN
jgi:hypothetical protein